MLFILTIFVGYIAFTIWAAIHESNRTKEWYE